ncbi:hypothetical protein EAL2_c18590 [Peptoclostridium acidaminophilum DSM 3953]|uniref:UPF0735 ACT domain-containing protein EAL2_c18590 n=1 Tax=Peptoclostridium acidaminophilum DSM 3953 TaxID=1286171 RepID=W8T8H0_PEPAC|nr:ACT domain-containing protein [Peptoclostridium acidaminophilum]AHM57140.1 hypothetical protein EAL2_c18590 [Peptoclostridium acidaminophilum DSM 3953]
MKEKNSGYLIVDKEILPDVFEKVVKAKDMLRTGKAKGITQACKFQEISRSTFYKYKDYVFAVSEAMRGRKATIIMILDHTPGVLSDVLNKLAELKGNILTISQDIPINNAANVSITLDISDLEIEIDELVSRIHDIDGVFKSELMAVE